MIDVVVATRSSHKMAEIRDLLASVRGLALRDLLEVGVPESPEEAQIEAFDTFEENALAKARHFARATGRPVLADDSGLCVEALGGAPGVYSKRFSGRVDLSGQELDEANNQRLLQLLDPVPDTERSAHYVCLLALVLPGGAERLFRGTVDGVILREPRGFGGFGYDPLFFVPSLDATFAEVAPATKNALSHRARAAEAAIPTLREIADTDL